LKRILVILLVLFPVLAIGQEARPAGQLLLVLPFENKSTAPGLEWIGESFPEVLNQRMAEPSLFIIGREDRIFAFDHMGVPATSSPSRATIYTVAQQMDVDYVVLGTYTYDGRNFVASAQVLDMQNLRLTQPSVESGPLTDLIHIQTALAYNLLSQLHLSQLPARDQFTASQPQVRLDSLENYVRGVLALSQPDKIRRFKEAVRISPDYTFAKLQLARTYYNQRDYEQAATWFAKVSRNTPQALEASFFYGICEYQLGDMAKAQEAFQFVASKLPLTEVQNNLGVVTARKNKWGAIDFFRRAVQTDPRDPDYRFNLAVALSQTGNTIEAQREAKEALALKPGDSDTRALLDQLSRPFAATATPISPLGQANTPPPIATAPQRTFSPRLKRNYDETTFRQAQLALRNLEDAALAAKGPERHAGSLVDRGNDLLKNGFLAEAEAEFRDALSVEPQLAAPHVGLAKIALKKNDMKTALQEIDRALALDSNDTEAQKLKHDLATKVPERAKITDLH
jgi:tetratricopeptide (TPR) repeat protein